MRMHGRAAQVAGVAATRPALWQGTPHAGRRHYRLMRDHLTPVPQSLLKQLVQMPEVATCASTTTPLPPNPSGPHTSGVACISGVACTALRDPAGSVLLMTDGKTTASSRARCVWHRAPSRRGSSA